MKGFFSNHQLQSKNKNKSRHPKCGKCGLQYECHSPKMPRRGKGKRNIFFLAEAPGELEDARNEQLVGKSGKFLANKLRRLFDIEMNRDGYKLNAVNCRPPQNRNPTGTEIQCCRPYVHHEILKTKPNLILTMGEYAIKSVIGDRWKKEFGGIGRWRGWAIPDRYFNAWVCPVFHPSYIQRKTTPEVAKVIFEQDLERAFELIDEPVPKFEKEENLVEILKHRDDIETYLKNLIGMGPRLTAFDFETTGQKPHKDIQEIVSCAICDGWNHVVSFPMLPEIVPMFKRYLASNDILKIAANLGYENWWCKEMLDANVNGWWMDINLSAHIEDNRPRITSVKFQAAVRYGLIDYDSHIEQYLKADSGYERNRIKELPLIDVLIYNGLDSLLEYRIALDHACALGIPLPSDKSAVEV